MTVLPAVVVLSGAFKREWGRLIFWTSQVYYSTVKAWFGASLKHLNKPKTLLL
jgi:hypothetical protein